MKKVLLAAGLSFAMLAAPAVSYAQISVGVAINLAPPPLPVYEQPPVPAPNYLWTPGYWAYGDEGYFWVPGTWVEAPQEGYLWTPGYWGYGDGGYVFHQGYWGAQIGFYGGINYGFGYGGSGYQGGHWDHGQFAYNRSVNNITNTTVIRNVYNERVVNNTVTHVSFNGGSGGIQAQPSAAERQFEAGPHLAPTSSQQQHLQQAKSDRNQLASVNHGAPPVAATARPGAMSGPGVVHASGAGGPIAHQAPGQPAAHGAVPQPPHSAQVDRAPGESAPHAPQAEHAAPMQREQVQHAPQPVHQAAPQREQEQHAPTQHAPAERAPEQHAPAPAEHAPAPRAPAEHAPAPHQGGEEHKDEHNQ